jgi:hypothetical protein
VDTIPKVALEGLYHPAEENEQDTIERKEEEAKHDERYD